MHFKRFIAVWALLAIMLGQVALAQHNAAHIEHIFSQEKIASHDGHDDHHHDQEDNQKHECHECALIQSLQSAFYNAPALLSIDVKAEPLTIPAPFYIIVGSHYKSNPPRAPPFILI